MLIFMPNSNLTIWSRNQYFFFIIRFLWDLWGKHGKTRFPIMRIKVDVHLPVRWATSPWLWVKPSLWVLDLSTPSMWAFSLPSCNKVNLVFCKEETTVLLSSLLSKVDQEIVKVVQERMRACHQREGHSYLQNCAKEIQLFNEVTKNFQSRCKYCAVWRYWKENVNVTLLCILLVTQ